MMPCVSLSVLLCLFCFFFLFSFVSCFFFFFQAEDGIRDHCVTGVQTCALPIYVELHRESSLGGRLQAELPSCHGDPLPHAAVSAAVHLDVADTVVVPIAAE